MEIGGKRRDWWLGVPVGLAILLFTALLLIASRIQIDYFDAFHCLSNAKTIANGQGPFDIRRFLFPSVVQAPWFWIEARMQWEGFGFRAAHIANIFLVALWGWLTLKTFSRRMPLTWAAPATLAVLALPLVIHYAPSAKEDLLAAALVSLALYWFLEKRGEIPLGVVTGLAVMSRYNLMLSLPLFFSIGFYQRGGTRQLIRFLGVLFVVVLLLPTMVYPLFGLASPLSAFPEFLRGLWLQVPQHRLGYQPPGVFFQFWLATLALPWSLLFFFGLWKKRREEEIRFHALWVALYFLLHAFVFAGKEARYLFPILPSVLLIAVSGLESFPKTRIRTWLVILLLAHGTLRAAGELSKFRDPFYTTQFQKTVSARVKELAGGHRIFWVGNYYGLHPREAIFHREDRFAYLYHFHSHVVRFFTNRPVISLFNAEIVPPPPGSERPWYALPGAGAGIRTGDVILVNPDTRNNVTDNLSTLQPLTLQRARLQPATGKFQDGEYELYGRTSSEAPWQSAGMIRVEQGKLSVPLIARAWRDLQLLDFDIVEHHEFTF